ncbi:Disease resistance protein [Melia azedarach]|uniref:Disease resistance protein n=1 Tax=Melia azedarach TaxID=155640 RepID=A0ACC1YLC8_MELAZ|nr:Disease resistance protein [Melia azedarach]
MVDAVVSFVVERLGDYLIQEAVFLAGVKSEVLWLKKELEWMLCFIKDAEQKQVDNPLIRQWLSDITDIAYDTEDVLDKYMLQVNNNGRILNLFEEDEDEDEDEDADGGNSERRPGFFDSIKECSCILKKESGHKRKGLYSKGKEKVTLYSIGKEIEALKNRINDLSSKRSFYGLENIDYKRDGKGNDFGRLKQLRRATSFAIEEGVVGFEDVATKLLAKLLEYEPRRFVISIFGMGGLGKTTLARKLYHNKSVKNKFDCCAWVSVSQDYNTRDLLKRLIKSFKIGTATEKLEQMSEDDLERCLHEFLQESSYLVVVDDVWQKEAWQSLKRAFPDNHNGSRVIITTRIKEAAERSDERTHVHILRFLTPDESWQLFCQKAFQNSNADRAMEKIGREMVEKCGGLPLAIVVLGGLLSTKRLQEWHVVRDHIWRFLRKDSIEISYLLALSFNDLPYQLKLCFLYLGIFPEDFEINVEKLVPMLVGEGFIPQAQDQIMEDIAKDYLNELINRSLIQAEKRCWGRIVTCRVHDLLRDLAIEKAKQLNFIHIYDESKSSTCYSNTLSSCRRQAIYSETERCLWLKQCHPISRSMLVFNIGGADVIELIFNIGGVNVIEPLPPMSKRFKLLRVINIECSKLLHLPEEIGNLIFLKYLGLRNLMTGEFPESLINLARLQTLDVLGCWAKLPSDICKLQELRHLFGFFHGPLPVETLTNLQTLKFVSVESWSKVNPEKLINLRELQLRRSYSSEEKEFTFDSFAKLKSLRILSVKLEGKYYVGSLQPLIHCKHLLDLKLSGKIEKLPEDMHELLPNLECFSLSNSHLKDDPMPILEKLPSLTILELGINFYSGKKLKCTAKGFPQLEILQLIDFDDIEEWEVDVEAMPKLKGLRNEHNSKMRIPERLRRMPTPAEGEFDRQDWYH